MGAISPGAPSCSDVSAGLLSASHAKLTSISDVLLNVGRESDATMTQKDSFRGVRLPPFSDHSN